MNWNDEIVGLWPTPILRSEMHDQAWLDRLAVVADSDASRSGDELFSEPDAAMQQLREHIAAGVRAYFQHCDEPAAPAWRLRARVEKLAYGESRPLQSRPGAYLSGILYLRAPKNIESLQLRNDVFPGRLTLLDPRPGFNMCSIEGDPYHEQNLMMEPQPGLFVMWPAFVGFYQHPNLSRSEQLYISFDVVATERETSDVESAGRWNGDIHDMWSTGLIKRRLPGYKERNPELIDIIDTLERENPDLTTDFNAERFRSYKHPAMDWLMSNINQSITSYFKQFGINQELSWQIASWSNINRFGDYHSPHNHPWSYLSGTYYVQVPDSENNEDGHDNSEAACISHYDPRSGMSRYAFEPGSRGSNVHTLRPVPGALLLWPSAVHHFVHPNLSTDKRYSISFNIHLQR
jgi:uncharacterized protein (TIGR02466 family)